MEDIRPWDVSPVLSASCSSRGEQCPSTRSFCHSAYPTHTAKSNEAGCGLSSVKPRPKINSFLILSRAFVTESKANASDRDNETPEAHVLMCILLAACCPTLPSVHSEHPLPEGPGDPPASTLLRWALQSLGTSTPGPRDDSGGKDGEALSASVCLLAHASIPGETLDTAQVG